MKWVFEQIWSTDLNEYINFSGMNPACIPRRFTPNAWETSLNMLITSCSVFDMSPGTRATETGLVVAEISV